MFTPMRLLPCVVVGALDVKALDAEGIIYDVKAIQDAGNDHIFDIKALTPDGERLDVKGVSRAGSLLAVGAHEELYGVKAISRSGHVSDVKGVKTSDEAVEGNVNGVDVQTHIKALPQVP